MGEQRELGEQRERENSKLLQILPRSGIFSKKNLSREAEVFNQGASTVFSYNIGLIRSGKILSLAN